MRRCDHFAAWGRLGAVIAAVALLAPAAAAADAEEARVHERRARQLFRAGDYEAALAELEQERQLDPTPDVAFRLALCLDRLHRPVDAYRAYAEYLAMTEEGGEERLRRQAERSLRRIGRRVARITVTSEPTGAQVFVDDSDAPAATTPGLVVLAPGEHRLSFRLAGHRPHEAPIDAARGEETELAATLEAEAGGVLVVEAPEGAQVAVRGPDGQSVGEGPAPLRLELAPGAYEAALSPEGDGGPAWRSVAVAAGETTTARLSASDDAGPGEASEGGASERRAARQRRRGRAELRVAASPDGARVFVDGHEVGVAPLAVTDLRAGPHVLRLEADGREPWRARLSIGADEEVWLTGALASPPDVEHSPWSYVALGTGGAAVVAAIFTGIASITMRNDFEELTDPADPMPAAGLREQGIVVNGITDALWVVGALGLAAGVVLYIVTEEHTERPAEVRVTRGSR